MKSHPVSYFLALRFFYTAYAHDSPCLGFYTTSIINHDVSYTDVTNTSELSRIFATLDERVDLLRKRTKKCVDHPQAEIKSKRGGVKGSADGEAEDLRHPNLKRFHRTGVESNRMLEKYDEVR